MANSEDVLDLYYVDEDDGSIYEGRVSLDDYEVASKLNALAAEVEKLRAKCENLRAEMPGRLRREAAMRTLMVLVNEEVISSGKAREISNMSIEDQRAFWRKENLFSTCPAIFLRCYGDQIEVLVEVEKEWVSIIKETYFGGNGHIVERSGVESAVRRAREVE